MTAPHVVGIDLSLTATGVASSHGWCELVTSKGKRGDSYKQRSDRRFTLLRAIYTLAAEADLVVIEGPAYGTAGGSTWDRAGLWCVLYDCLTRKDIPVAVASGTGLKKYATGKGSALGKGAMVEAVTRRMPQYETGGDDNLADAIWLMAMGRDHLGHPIVAVPSVNREALDKVAWPEQDAA